MFLALADNDNFSIEEIYDAQLAAEHYDYQAALYPESEYHQEQKKFYWEQYYKMSGQWGEEGA